MRNRPPYYADDAVTVYHGRSEHVLPHLADASVDAVVTDPPYELGFMGRAWDASRIAYSVDLWREVWRVLKPGGHVLATGGTRTVHRLTCAIEDAGFEIRDGIDWLYGTGFPKSLDVSKAIDKAAGAQREVIGTRKRHGGPAGMTAASGWNDGPMRDDDATVPVTAPATDDAAPWDGWGTALKPAREPIVMARKPLAGTVAQNVLAYGTGAMHIDACRVGAEQRTNHVGGASSLQRVSRVQQGYRATVTTSVGEASTVTGRWPTNVVLSHAPLLDEAGEVVGDACADGCVPGCAVAELDRQSGTTLSVGGSRGQGGGRGAYGVIGAQPDVQPGYGDTGGASRFFPVFRYEAKASTAERPRTADGVAHPTVKPLALVRWMVRLITPPGGRVLDLFAGSGPTGEACVIEGFGCVLIEDAAPYLPLITARLTKPLQPALDFGEVDTRG